MKVHYKNPADFKISACTIAKNEEKTIAKSIESYKDYVDEIIVVDTGSTDETAKIAESMGAKVYCFEWCDDFAAAKNYALDKATGDWIIFLDADEYFADNTAENLRATILGAILQQKNAIGCRMEHIDSDSGEWIGEGFSVRGFMSGIRYRNPIHEEIFSKSTLDVYSVNKSYFYLKHTGYSVKLIKGKCERNLELLLKDLEEEKNILKKLIDYSYICDSYYGMGDYDKACEYGEMFIEQSEGKNVVLIGCEGKPYMNVIFSLERKKADNEQIAKFVEKYIEKYPDSAEAVFAQARLMFRTRHFRMALQKFGEAIELSDNNSGTYIDTVCVNKAKIYAFCGECEEALLNNAVAIDWYYKGYKETRNYQPAVYNILRVVRKMPQNELDRFVTSLSYEMDDGHITALINGLMCNYMAPQLITCYAHHRAKHNEETVNSTITAFLFAGQGKYKEASNLFHFTCKMLSSNDDAFRALLTAVLSGDRNLIEQAKEISKPVHAFALGLAEKPEKLSAIDLFDLASIYGETSRLGRMDFVTEKIKAVSSLLTDEQMISLANNLAESFAFEAALFAIRQTSFSAESVFLEGYFCYRLYRLNEAAALLALAKHIGYNKSDYDEIAGNLEAMLEKNKGAALLSEAQKVQAKAEIEQKLGAGDLSGADTEIEQYMQATEPDADLFALQTVLFFYMGEYRRAAVAVECGLLKDQRNVDLLYNGGCVYEKLGNNMRAMELYSAALSHCADGNLSSEIRQSIAMLEAS